jgi:SAM-dependent methyltransferase
MNSSYEVHANSIDAIHYKILEVIKDFPIGTVLDFPSGHGRLSHWLSNRGYNVTSCDIAVEDYTDSPVQHVYADLNKEFPFEDNKFDYCFCVDGPEHSENLYHVFREFYRVIKQGGLFIVSMPNLANIESRIKYLMYGVLEPITTGEQFRSSKHGTGVYHINRPSYAMLRMALEAAGFQIENVTYDAEKKGQRWFYPLYLLIRLITKFKGEKGDKKYWLKGSNSNNVLLGGNTLIVVCRKK